MELAQKMELPAPGHLPCFPAKEALVDEDVEQQMRSGKDGVSLRALPWWLLMSLLVFVRGFEDDHQPSRVDLDGGCKSTSTSRTASKGCAHRSRVTWLWFVTGIT